MGKGKFQPPHQINTPEPIDKKFGTIDYVREGTSYTKFGKNPFTRGWIFTRDSTKDVKSRKDVPFWGYKT